MRENNSRRPELELKAVEKAYAGTLSRMELSDLRAWVRAGNSPCENPQRATWEDGSPLGFIEWYRLARADDICACLYGTSPIDRQKFDFYTDRRSDHGSFEETKKYLRDAQTFLGCEILALLDFLRVKNLLRDYMRYRFFVSPKERDGSPF